MDCVHPDYRIDSIKGTGTPGLYFRENTVGYGTDRFGRDTVAEIFLHPVTDLACAVTKGIKSDDTVRHALRQDGLTFLYKLRLKT